MVSRRDALKLTGSLAAALLARPASAFAHPPAATGSISIRITGLCAVTGSPATLVLPITVDATKPETNHRPRLVIDASQLDQASATPDDVVQVQVGGKPLDLAIWDLAAHNLQLQGGATANDVTSVLQLNQVHGGHLHRKTPPGTKCVSIPLAGGSLTGIDPFSFGVAVAGTLTTPIANHAGALQYEGTLANQALALSAQQKILFKDNGVPVTATIVNESRQFGFHPEHFHHYYALVTGYTAEGVIQQGIHPMFAGSVECIPPVGLP